MLGVCDKIVPGLFIGAARFGYLPVMFLPAGPMPSGLPMRKRRASASFMPKAKSGAKNFSRLRARSYHSPGTCTFYGTANSNQMMMEMMGLHLPGSAFVNPDTPLRLPSSRTRRGAPLATTALGEGYIPFCDVIDERAIVNAIVGLHATGGSTNHAIHLVAMARAAGVHIDWDDFELSSRRRRCLRASIRTGSPT